jgi:hypothetical protein
MKLAALLGAAAHAALLTAVIYTASAEPASSWSSNDVVNDRTECLKRGEQALSTEGWKDIQRIPWPEHPTSNFGVTATTDLSRAYIICFGGSWGITAVVLVDSTINDASVPSAARSRLQSHLTRE